MKTKENAPVVKENSAHENSTQSKDTPTRTLRSKSKKEEIQSEDDKPSIIKTIQSPKKAQKRRMKSMDQEMSSSSPKAIKKERTDSIDDCENDKVLFQLNILNWPESWTHNKTIDYIEKECGYNNGCMSLAGLLTVTFENEKQCLEAKEKLSSKVLEEKKLKVWIGDILDEEISEDQKTPRGTFDTTLHIREEYEEEEEWKPTQDIWGKDPKGVYGLSSTYLKKLRITPPINQWIHVSNFRCDKSELKEVLELAGRLLALTVVHAKTKYAKAMYSHPLEAVQAVSMFHGQMFYGQALQVSIDKCPQAASKILPKGLAAIGPGLGIDGQPLRNVVKEFKRYFTDKDNLVNYKIFIDEDDDVCEDDGHEENKADEVEVRKEVSEEPEEIATNDERSSKLSNADQESDRDSPDLSRSEMGTPSRQNDDVRSLKSDMPGKIKVIDKSLSFLSKNINVVRNPFSGPIKHQVPIGNSGPSNVGWSQHMNYSNNPGYAPNGQINNIRPNPSFGPTMPGPGYNAMGPSGPMGPNGPMVPTSPMGQNGPMGANGPMGHTSQIGPNGPIHHGPAGHMGPNIPHFGHARPIGPVGSNSGYMGSNHQMGPGYSAPIGPPSGPIFRPNGPPAINTNNYNRNRMGNTSTEPPVPGTNTKPGLLALRGPDAQTLHLRNVPEDMTFSELSARLSAIGSVMCLQMTAASSATVKFATPGESEKCFQSINNM